MGKCCRCGAVTLHESGVPFCIGCADEIDTARKQTAQQTKTSVVAIESDDSWTHDLGYLTW
jgi:hypothetical protein